MALERRQNGKWSFYGTLNGKRYRRSGFDTKREAKAAEADFRKHIENEKEYITISELIDRFLEFKKDKIKDYSLYHKKITLDRLSKRFNIQDTPISQINRNIMQNMFDELSKEYKMNTLLNYYSTFNQIYDYAIKNELLNDNPLKFVELNKPDKIPKETSIYEPDDFKRLIKYVDDIETSAILIVLFYMGVRIGECLALTWNDINFSSKTMDISKTANRMKNEYVSSPKTKNSYRKITMPNVVVNALKSLYNIKKEYVAFNDSMFVFGNGEKPLTQHTVRNRYFKILDKANANGENLERIRLHDFRHSHASYLINNMSAGFTDFDIAKRLGHSVSMLHKTYAHWFKSADKGIVDFMNSEN